MRTFMKEIKNLNFLTIYEIFRYSLKAIFSHSYYQIEFFTLRINKSFIQRIFIIVIFI